MHDLRKLFLYYGFWNYLADPNRSPDCSELI